MSQDTNILDRRAADIRAELVSTLADLRVDIGDDYSASDEPDHYDITDTEIGLWFERDRAHVALEAPDGRTLIEWWDEDVAQAIEDGTLNPRDYHGSAFDHAYSLGLTARPSMQITIGSDVNLSGYAVQTGDNSYTGAAYGLPHWAVGALYRDDTDESVDALATDLLDQLLDQIADSPEHAYPHLSTVSDYDRFVAALERGLRGLDHVSTGAMAGCADCAIPAPTTDTTASSSDPLIFGTNMLLGARQIPDYAICGDEFTAHSFDPTAARQLEALDDGWGDLYVYGDDFGPTHVVRADSYDSALEAVYDALPPIAASDLPDAYGYDDADAFARAVERTYDYPELVEGYYHQANATGTGIVAPSPHEWLAPLDREHAVALRILVDTNADSETAGRVAFTTAACDICNRPLGGEREPVHGIDSDGELVHLDACRDCFYYITYGTLDDSTMIDLGID